MPKSVVSPGRAAKKKSMDLLLEYDSPSPSPEPIERSTEMGPPQTQVSLKPCPPQTQVSLKPCPPQTQLTLIQSEPSKTCPHGLVRYLEPCGVCWEQLQRDAFGWVVDSKFSSAPKGDRLCVHGVRQRRCKVCVGSRICSHGKEKWYCNACDGSRMCIACRRHIVGWVGTTCKTCKAKEEGRVVTRGGQKKAKVPKPEKPKGPPRKPGWNRAKMEREERERRRLAGETVSTPVGDEKSTEDSDSAPETPGESEIAPETPGESEIAPEGGNDTGI